MRRLTCVLGMSLLLFTSTAEAAGVVVFPLDARNVADTVADKATKAILRSVDKARALKLISQRKVKADLGMAPAERARECDYDVFCLVEIGELVGADQVISGHLRQPDTGPPRYELKLVAVDVMKASITDVVRWTVPIEPKDALLDAADAAARRLLTAPDASWPVLLQPDDAELEVYGERFTPKKLKGRFWSGRYRVRVTSPGHESDEQVVVINRGQNRSFEVALLVDPTYKPERSKDGRPFDQSSRRLGSGAQAGTVGGSEVVGPSEPAAYQTPWPYAVGGAGVVVAVVGSVLMVSGQNKYNNFADQPRYESGTGAGFGVSAARENRDRAQSQHRLGSGLTLAGSSMVAGAAVWMLIDLLTREDGAR